MARVLEPQAAVRPRRHPDAGARNLRRIPVIDRLEGPPSRRPHRGIGPSPRGFAASNIATMKTPASSAVTDAVKLVQERPHRVPEPPGSTPGPLDRKSTRL